MSCFFCESNFHISTYCDIYVSDESRKAILDSKNRCHRCFQVKTIQHKTSRCKPLRKSCYTKNCCCLKITNVNHNSASCKPFRKCFICYSKSHSSVLCPNRFTVQYFFIPNIDVHLFIRFVQMFDSIERYSLALASLEMQAATKILKPLKIIEKAKFNEYFRNYFLLWRKIDSLDLNTENVIIRRLELKDTQMDTNCFRELLLYNVRILKCSNVEFSSKILFSEILKLAPNIASLEVDSVSIELTSLWPEALLNYKNVNNMKRLKIKVKSLDFCVKSLAELMKKQLAINILIIHNLDIEPIEAFDYLKYRKTIVEKLSKYFIQTSLTSEITSGLCITAECKDHHHVFDNFILKGQ